MATNTTDVRAAVTSGYEHPLVSWRAIVAGTLITLLTFAILAVLGVALGGIAVHHAIDSESGAKAIGIGAGIWVVASALIALFAGSYFAGRVSTFVSPMIGAAQGLVIASLFLLMFLYQTGATLGSVAGAIGSVVGSTAEVAANNSDKVASLKNTRVGQEVQARITRDLDLKQSPDVVAQGVVSRLIAGDQEGAKAYLASQSNISTDEADRRINEVQAQVTANAKEAGRQTADVASGAGWTLFAMLILGTLVSALGGAAGSRSLAGEAVVRHTRRRSQVGHHATV